MTKPTNEHGSVIVIALVLLAISSMIGLISSRITRTDLTLANSYVQQKQAFYAAEAGLNHAVAIVGTVSASPDDPSWTNMLTGTMPTGERYSVLIKHKVSSGSVIKWGDVDGNFVFEECSSCSGKPVERIVSTGFSRGGAQQSVAAEVYSEPLFADPPAALYVGGTSFVNEGTGTDIEGEYGYIVDTATCKEFADVVTTSTATSGREASDFTGRTGLRAVLLDDQRAYPVAQVIDKLKDQAEPVTATDNLVLGSSEDYGLYYSSANFNMNNLSGYGMLLIGGNANIGGNISWHGLILTKGDARLVEGLHQEVYGAFLAGGSLEIDGSSEIYYDCREMNNIKNKFSKYSRRIWTSEVPSTW
jgi:Tfp pilus assembly protein PilX